MEQHTPGRADVEALKQLRVDQGQEDHFLQLRNVAVQAPHLVKCDAGIHLHALVVLLVSSWHNKFLVAQR